MVPRQSGFNGPPISPRSGNTQGGIFSPGAFNIQIDCVIQHWLKVTINDNGIVNNGFGPSVEQILALFYTDSGCITPIDPEWLQHALTVLTHLFKRIGLQTTPRRQC
jgi:hypothetical protein